MKFTKNLLLLILLMNGMACEKESKGELYSAHGISFQIPEGWTHAETPMDGSGVFIMLEKGGLDESGFYSIGILDEKVSTTAQIDMMKERMDQNLSIQDIQVNYSKTQEESFNGIAAVSCQFDYTNEALKFDGLLKAFHCGEKTVYILQQEEVEDQAKNKEGLKLLKETFACH